MITDNMAACACCTAALAALKGLMPSNVKVVNPGGSEEVIAVTYEVDECNTIAMCRNFCAYAEYAEKDFSLHMDGLDSVAVAENNDLINMIFLSASKIMDDMYGADLYLMHR